MASPEVLKDPLGRVIARIYTDKKGIRTIKDQLGVVLGTYDPKTNNTRNYLGQLIGKGDLLTSLINR